MLFKTWSAGKKIFKGEFNISTPLYGKYVRPNVMLVPLLAFDKKNRLGYGGGFYDRTISHLQKTRSLKTTIGIAFNEQEIDYVPVMKFDKRLNKIVTPKGII